MQQPDITSCGSKPARSAWDELFMGFVILLTIVLLVTVIRRVALVAVVLWVYGRAGYDSGIRVHFVGKTPWFTNGQRVPDAVTTFGSFGAFIASILASYVAVYCVRYVYRLIRKGGR